MYVISINLEENGEFTKDGAKSRHIKIEEERGKNRALWDSGFERDWIGLQRIKLNRIGPIREVRTQKGEC